MFQISCYSTDGGECEVLARMVVDALEGASRADSQGIFCTDGGSDDFEVGTTGSQSHIHVSRVEAEVAVNT